MSQGIDNGYGRQFASFYDRLFPHGADVDEAVSFLANQLPTGTGILELGVGTGRIAVPLAAVAGPIVGVDSSPEMLALLQDRAATEASPVEAVHADIRTFRDERRFGLVYCVCGTLSMLLDPADQAAALVTAARHLAPGGVLVIETHNAAAVEAMHAGRVRDSYFVPYPGRDSGLLSYSMLDLARRLWHLSHIFFDDGRANIAAEVSRLTLPAEVDEYAKAAGLVAEKQFGSWSGAAPSGLEPMFIATYRLEEDAQR